MGKMREIIRWCYKTVHYELKKEGILGGIFLDEAEVEESLNNFGRAGWELVSIMEIHGGLIAIFKQPINVPLSPVEDREKEIITPKEVGNDDHQEEEAETGEKSVDDDEEQDRDNGVGTIRIE